MKSRLAGSLLARGPHLELALPFELLPFVRLQGEQDKVGKDGQSTRPSSLGLLLRPRLAQRRAPRSHPDVRV